MVMCHNLIGEQIREQVLSVGESFTDGLTLAASGPEMAVFSRSP